MLSSYFRNIPRGALAASKIKGFVQMASVIINNTEKRQVEGTTLLNLQSSFPNCWLTRCEDNVEIRVPAYVLESRKTYILNKAAQSGNHRILYFSFD